MIKNLFVGEKVRLLVMNPEKDAEISASWGRDSVYARLLDSDPPRLWSKNQMKDWLEKRQKAGSFNELEMMIYPLESDEPIGFVALDGISWHHRSAWAGIGIGDRKYWSHGYEIGRAHV